MVYQIGGTPRRRPVEARPVQLLPHPLGAGNGGDAGRTRGRSENPGGRPEPGPDDELPAGPDGLRIGALTRHRTVELCADPAVLDGFGVLPRSARWIGHYPIRARGTFGGSIAHADPAAEWCLLALLLEANVVLTGPSGVRAVPVSEFFESFYTTSAGPDEMITELHFPRAARRAALTEFSPRQGDFAVVAAAVSVDLADTDPADKDPLEPKDPADPAACRSIRVVLGGVGPLPFVVDTAQLGGQ